MKWDFQCINCNHIYYEYDHDLKNENINHYISIDGSNNVLKVDDNNQCYHYKYTTRINN